MTDKERQILDYIASKRRLRSHDLIAGTSTASSQITTITTKLAKKGYIRKYKDGIYAVYNIVPAKYKELEN